ncbi:hypothetical protein HMPREF0262_02963 [Clostridium sp. ATCC 29733]|nr:hypothetical protein HMPREF0262_02963 [Clostridium sp. ATCC 29733]
MDAGEIFLERQRGLWGGGSPALLRGILAEEALCLARAAVCRRVRWRAVEGGACGSVRGERGGCALERFL